MRMVEVQYFTFNIKGFFLHTAEEYLPLVAENILLSLCHSWMATNLEKRDKLQSQQLTGKENFQEIELSSLKTEDIKVTCQIASKVAFSQILSTIFIQCRIGQDFSPKKNQHFKINAIGTGVP